MSKKQLQGPKNGCTNDQRVKSGYYGLRETTLIINDLNYIGKRRHCDEACERIVDFRIN